MRPDEEEVKARIERRNKEYIEMFKDMPPIKDEAIKRMEQMSYVEYVEYMINLFKNK